MMAYVGMFMGGSPGALIAAGKAVLNLQWQAMNRADIPGASFTVTGAGFNQTVQADTDGRAYMTVPVGEYTIKVNHAGEYPEGADDLKVNAKSQNSYLVYFDGVKFDIVDTWI